MIDAATHRSDSRLVYTLQTMVGATIAPCIRPISGLLVDVVDQQQTVFEDFLIPHLSVVTDWGGNFVV